MNIIFFTIITLTVIGIIAAVVLYFVARKFKVYEDPRIDVITDILPAANCGGCGFAGCRNFAESLVKSDDITALYCPVGGNAAMQKAAEILGKTVDAKDPLVAAVRCGGSFEHRRRTSNYDGAASCAIKHVLYTGDTDCPYGCLGCGDCAAACKFDALLMDAATGLPVVVDANCTACGACVKACPRNIIELRYKFKNDRKIFVSCMNRDKGGIARKYCNVACIGCNKCVKVCKFDAITLENNLAFIDSKACKLCRKCAPECSTHAIFELNFPPKRQTPPPAEKETPAATVEA
jgi:Na+-translocating ferredoxin:NAD+ oxidoreductase RNF subunit RnfB